MGSFRVHEEQQRGQQLEPVDTLVVQAINTWVDQVVSTVVDQVVSTLVAGIVVGAVSTVVDLAIGTEVDLATLVGRGFLRLARQRVAPVLVVFSRLSY